MRFRQEFSVVKVMRFKEAWCKNEKMRFRREFSVVKMRFKETFLKNEI